MDKVQVVWDHDQGWQEYDAQYGYDWDDVKEIPRALWDEYRKAARALDVVSLTINNIGQE